MKRIALINPPSPFLTEERVACNIGLVRVATHLKYEGYNVKLFDLAGDKDYLNSMENIGKQGFDLYGFSSTSAQFKITYKLFKSLKKVNPNARTLIGGSHASAISSLRTRNIEDKNIEILNEFDTVFEGEGENTENMFKDGWVKGKLIRNIDNVLIPDESFIDRKSYKYDVCGKQTTNIQTQRGCPFKCIFCCGRNIEMYNRVRNHSPERVLQEMNKLNKEYGYESFMWYDDEVNVNPKRLEILCKALAKRPYQHRGFVRSDLIVKYPETVKWLKKAGFVKLCTGVESGSDRILNIIGKNTTYAMNLEARRIIQEAGIHYESFFILGHPTETKKDIELTVKWIKEAKPDDWDLTILTPYPGSKIYDSSIKSTKFKDYNWEYNGLYFNKPDYSKEDSYYKGLEGKAKATIRTDELSEEYLKQIQEEIRCKLKNEK